MPQLACNASSCYHNKSNHCCKSAIDVAGQSATTSSATCCNSYYEKGDSFTNEDMSPNSNLYVACHANKCVHNQDCHCEADSIDISGANACNCEQTQCSSFSCK